MYTFVLQPWTTLTGTSGAAPPAIIQSEDAWLDLEAFTDLVIYWDIPHPVSGVLSLETAPTNDEALFAANWLAVTNLGGLHTYIARAKGSARPLAKFVRWKFTPPASSTWSITFRGIVSANPSRRRT